MAGRPGSAAHYVVAPMASPATRAEDASAAADTSAPTGRDPAPADGARDAGDGRARTPAERGDAELDDRVLLLAVALVTLPIFWMGYGTDIDVTDVLRAADSVRAGDYAPSRAPGVPVFEAVAAVLEPIGGHILLNLATAAAAGATVVGVARLVRAWGHDNGDLIALAFLASPVTIIASSSVGDFVWALAFFVWGAVTHVRDRSSVVSGALFALALGARLSTGFVLAAFLVADGWDPGRRWRAVRTALVTAPLAVAVYVPSWLAYGRSRRMFETAEGFRSITNNLGRFAYKNYASAGVVLVIVLLVALPALLGALRGWWTDPMLRFGVLGFAAVEALFFQLPWKPAHLLPALLALLLWLGASQRNRRPYLWVVVGAIAINGLVTFRPLAPDQPHAATSGRWDPAVTAGLLANDVACRLDVMDEPLPQPLNSKGWDCTLKPLQGPVADGD
jgi:hypothetical protein